MRWTPTLSPDGSRLAARTPTGTVRLLDTASWREVAQLASPIGRMDALAFSPDGGQLATLTQETGILALWRSEDGAFVQSFAGSAASTIYTTATQVAFSSDGKQLMSSLGTQIVLDGANTSGAGLGSDAFLSLFGGGTTLQLRFVGGAQRVFRDLRYAVGNSPGSVRLSVIDLPTHSQTTLFEQYDRALSGLAVSGDGSRIAVGTDHSEAFKPQGLRLYDVTRPSPEDAALATLEDTFTGTVLAFSPDGAALYTLDGTTVEVRDGHTLSVTGRLDAPAGTFVAVAPGGALLFADEATQTTAWWDPGSGATRRTAPFLVSAPTWTGNGALGASAGRAGTLFHVWREEDGEVVCEPGAASDGAAIQKAAVSSNGAQLAVVHADGTVDVSPVAADGSVMSATASVSTGLSPAALDWGLAVSDDGRRVGVAGALSPNALTGRVVAVDTASGQTLVSEVSDGYGDGFVMSPDGARLGYEYYVDVDRLVRGIQVVDVLSGRVALDLQPSTSAPSTAFIGMADSFSPDGERIAIRGNGLTVYRLADGTKERAITAPDGAVSSWPALSPDWSLSAGELYDDKTGTSRFQVWHVDGAVVYNETPTSVWAAPTFDASGSIVGTMHYAGHTHAQDYVFWQVSDIATGTTLRTFPEDVPAGVMLPHGVRVLTVEGTGIAVWCR
jgi:WD40 repeat protein